MAVASSVHVSAQTLVNINQNLTYQQMIGFGASLTDSGAAAIATLSPASQSTLMQSLFNASSGAGLSFLRQPIGASDFRLADYTYDDVAGDYSLSHFSIGHDTTPYQGSSTSIVSLLKSALAINPQLSVMGAPWTAPGWMKNGAAGNIVSQTGVNESLYGGTLNTDSQTIQSYANYFVKYVQAYAAQGIKVSYISPQNEPYYNGGYAYPSMVLTTSQQASLITGIGQAFQTSLVDPALSYNATTNPYIASQTKIEMLDHNWSDAVDGSNASTNITTILNNPAVAQYVDGIAFHGYGGDVSAQNIIHAAYPTKNVLFTEQTGTIGSNFASDLMYDMANLVVGGTRDWASTVVKFNLALDQNSGPKIETVTFNNGGGTYTSSDSGDNNARGVVTISSQTGAITYNEEYYALGQIAKFVQPGALRVASDSDHSVTFINPDKTMAVVAYNDAASAAAYQFNWNGNEFVYNLPAQSVATFTWLTEVATPAVAVTLTTGDMANLLTKQPGISFSQGTWNSASGGDWNTVGNWTAGVPNGSGAVANLLGVIASNQTIASSVPIVIGTLRFNNVNHYSIAGTGSLTLQSAAGSALVDVQSGVHIIQLPITLATSALFQTDAASAQLMIEGPLTLNPGVALTTSGNGSIVYSSSITLGIGASMTIANSTAAGVSNLGSNSRMSLSRTIATVQIYLQLNGLAIGSNATMDIADDEVNVHGGSIAAVNSEVRSAYSGGTWQGSGITSTLAENDPLHLTTVGVYQPSASVTVDGHTVLPTDVFIKYTYYGDANLDGKIDGSDYSRTDSGFLAHLTGWFNGDFNYDGVIDGSDYTLLDNAFNSQGSQLTANISTATNQVAVTTVPEPWELTWMPFICLLASRSRRILSKCPDSADRGPCPRVLQSCRRADGNH